MPVWSFRAIVLIAPIPLSLNVWTHSPPSHVEKSLVTHRRRHSGALATASSSSEEPSGIIIAGGVAHECNVLPFRAQGSEQAQIHRASRPLFEGGARNAGPSSNGFTLLRIRP